MIVTPNTQVGALIGFTFAIPITLALITTDANHLPEKFFNLTCEVFKNISSIPCNELGKPFALLITASLPGVGSMIGYTYDVANKILNNV